MRSGLAYEQRQTLKFLRFLVITSLGLMVLILLHRGKGGGLVLAVGRTMQSSLSGSSVVERILTGSPCSWPPLGDLDRGCRIVVEGRGLRPPVGRRGNCRLARGFTFSGTGTNQQLREQGVGPHGGGNPLGLRVGAGRMDS